ncbi:hypothetical protein SK128_006331 [Halocaridina rubra]|uniref:Uncharacterized protein n=1 Tax=Halocaridina rubra TaxID=373956 RepID=A0AAN8ZXL2_HALRR
MKSFSVTQIFSFIAVFLLFTNISNAKREQTNIYTNVSNSFENRVSFRESSWARETKIQQVHKISRKKRLARFPVGSDMELKWSINVPFPSYTDYGLYFKISLPIKVPFPDFLSPDPIVRADEDETLYIDEYKNDYQYPLYDQHFYTEDSNLNWISQRKRDARTERKVIYTQLEEALENIGSNGRQCLLRAICDIGEAPLELGILGEIINTIFTASSAGRSKDPSEDNSYDTFIEAELHGKLNGDCAMRYPDCKVSPFDLIPYLIQTYT